MIYCIRRNWHGIKDLDPFGYQQVTKIQIFFINGPAIKDAKTKS